MLLRLKEHSSVSFAFPPVDRQRAQRPTHKSTVSAWLKTVVTEEHPGHCTSMK